MLLYQTVLEDKNVKRVILKIEKGPSRFPSFILQKLLKLENIQKIYQKKREKTMELCKIPNGKQNFEATITQK